MFRAVFIFNVFCVFFTASINPGPQYPPTNGEVWPLPQKQEKYATYFKLTPADFQFTKLGKSCTILDNAIQRYTAVLKNMHRIAQRYSANEGPHHHNVTWDNFRGTLDELKITLTSPCEEYPHLDMDERYSLNISEESALHSKSIWGVLRGMETFAQLLYLSDDYTEVRINRTEILDYPRYPHRGLMIDTSRHYIAVANILKTLDAMEMNKMNVLHWHIVDDQSFPYQSKVYPALSEKGAYFPTMIYTAADISRIVSYARDRGIRVLPEFDVPGHTRSWGEAYPIILADCYQSGHKVGLGPMDPTHNATYTLLRHLIAEVQERFPDKYFHLGGDEVELSCWNSNPELQEFMKEHNMTNASELHAYFMTNVIPLLGKRSKPILWQEVFDEGVTLPNNAILQVWKTEGGYEMSRILKAGYTTLYSASWYLSMLQHGGDWQKFYKADPRLMIDDKILDLNKILGGEACMWGEVVDDRNIISRVWPRACAVAEKLWSAASDTSKGISIHVYHRLEEHACRMNRREVQAQPPNGPGFCAL